MFQLMTVEWYLRKLPDIVFPKEANNPYYQEYLAWVAEGNTPLPVSQEDMERWIKAKIEAIESATHLNRGSRELELRLMEKEAAELSTDEVTPEQVLSNFPYYAKLKALDKEVKELRQQL